MLQLRMRLPSTSPQAESHDMESFRGRGSQILKGTGYPRFLSGLRSWSRVNDSALASLCRFQGLSGRALSLESLDCKFFDFSVAVYPPHTPESGAWHLGEARVWE